jgi:hypothetical protein
LSLQTSNHNVFHVHPIPWGFFYEQMDESTQGGHFKQENVLFLDKFYIILGAIFL